MVIVVVLLVLVLLLHDGLMVLSCLVELRSV